MPHVAASTMMRTALRLVGREVHPFRLKPLLTLAIIAAVAAAVLAALNDAVRTMGNMKKKSIYTATITLAATTITITTIIATPAVMAVTAEEGRQQHQSRPTFLLCRLPRCRPTSTSSRRR